MNVKKGKEKKMKKKVLTTLSIVLILGLAALGILAYLSDTDSDVNVMALGNVQIEQIEQERGTDGSLQDFTGNDGEEGKPLYPATIELTDANKDGDLWPLANNAVDKLVSVENTGKSEAYVRTWFAFEYGNEQAWAKVNLNININKEDWTWNWEEETAEIDGVTYKVACAVYNAKLAPKGTEGSVTQNSLRQVALDPSATNEDIAVFGDTYVVKVFTQAGQTTGFEGASTYSTRTTSIASVANDALNTMFGTDHPWAPKKVSDAEELVEAIEAGEDVVLTEDINLDNPIAVTEGSTTTIDLNGKDLSVNTTESEAIVATGENTVVNLVNTSETEVGITMTGTTAMGVSEGATLNVKNVTINVPSENDRDAEELTDMIFAVTEGTLNIENTTLELDNGVIYVLGYDSEKINLNIKNSVVKSTADYPILASAQNNTEIKIDLTGTAITGGVGKVAAMTQDNGKIAFTGISNTDVFANGEGITFK